MRCLKDSDISLITYVPDVNISQATQLMEQDPTFHVVSATREEEAIGIAAGAYAAGRNAAVFMQSSGFGNSINALASLCILYRIPLPLFINLRGQMDEFSIAQVTMGRSTRPILDTLGLPYYTLDNADTMGRSTRPILDTLGLPYYTLDNADTMARIVSGALTLCYASRQPLALCMTPLLYGGKLA